MSWFVGSIRELPWFRSREFGRVCMMGESEERPYPQVGFSMWVLQPGQPNGMYHHEPNTQEDFLVVSGECVLLIDGEERRLQAWDFVHCPPGTDHIFVGAGDGPCAIFMIGGRVDQAPTVYPPSELAARYGASAADPERPYAPFGDWGPSEAPDGPWTT